MTLVQLQLTTTHLALLLYGGDVNLSMHQLCMLLCVHTTCRHAELPIPSVLTACEWTMFGGATFTAGAWALRTGQHGVH